jgi:hypothetical protein
MLNPFIIDQIKKREQEQRRRGDGTQPVLELPVPMPTAPHPTSEDDEGGERGIFIIDLF